MSLNDSGDNDFQCDTVFTAADTDATSSKNFICQDNDALRVENIR